MFWNLDVRRLSIFVVGWSWRAPSLPFLGISSKVSVSAPQHGPPCINATTCGFEEANGCLKCASLPSLRPGIYSVMTLGSQRSSLTTAPPVQSHAFRWPSYHVRFHATKESWDNPQWFTWLQRDEPWREGNSTNLSTALYQITKQSTHNEAEDQPTPVSRKLVRSYFVCSYCLLNAVFCKSLSMIQNWKIPL